MKRIVLLGDSIRMGYCEHVARIMEGRACVQWPAENGRFTLYAVASMDNWAREVGNPGTVDAVHWNCGHWDMARFGNMESPLLTVEEYRAGLRRVYARIRQAFPNAKTMFALTTPVKSGAEMANPRTNADIEEYNRAACEVMEELGVPVNDLHSVALALTDDFYADAVHYLPEGSEVLAEAVANKIDELLSD